MRRRKAKRTSGERPASAASAATLEEFVESMALFYEDQGIPRIAGRIWALMLVTAEPLSAEQIAERLQASRGSVSINLRVLITLGLVDKVSVPGSRLDYYRFSPDAWESIITMRMQSFVPLQSVAKRGLAALPSNHAVRHRLDALIELVETHKQFYEHTLAEWRAHHTERS